MKKRSVILGTKDGEHLPGTPLRDIILGKKGDDTLEGGDGNDWLFGGKGNDKLFGGNGNDKLFGGKGSDYLDGGAGNDYLFGGKGDDTFNFTLSENVGAKNYYDGGKGSDTLQLTLTHAEYEAAKAEIDKFEAFIAEGGKEFHFETLGLTVRSFEHVTVEKVGGSNTAPVADDDTIAGTLTARIKVAVVGSDPDPILGGGSSYIAAAGQLDPALFNATAIAHSPTADWATILAGYDVVVIGDDGIGADYTGSGIFEALYNFITAGGGVITTGWFANRLAEYVDNDPNTVDYADLITPIAPGTPSFARTGTTIDIDPAQPHDITAGIASYSVDAFAHDLAVTADATATVLATHTTSSGTELQAIAVDEVGAGRTAFLGNVYMGNDAFSPSVLRAGLADQIFERAVSWAAGTRETAATDEDSVLEILRSTLLANDSDADGDALAIALLSATSTLGAALSINAAGNFLYDPRVALNHLAEGEIVEDSFDYQLSDGSGGFDVAKVSLKVLGLADPAPAASSFEETFVAGLEQSLTTSADADALL